MSSRRETHRRTRSIRLILALGTLAFPLFACTCDDMAEQAAEEAVEQTAEEAAEQAAEEAAEQAAEEAQNEPAGSGGREVELTGACAEYKKCCNALVEWEKDRPQASVAVSEKDCKQVDEWKELTDSERACKQAMDAMLNADTSQIADFPEECQ